MLFSSFYFQLPAECTCGDIQKKYLTHTALFQLLNMVEIVFAEKWTRIPLETIKKVLNRRRQTVITSRDGPTPYKNNFVVNFKFTSINLSNF